MHAPVAVSGLGKKYGENFVLKKVSFELRAGETFGLIGLNGAGKTTLMKILLDLARATEGSATLFGKPSGNSAARGNLSYLPEKFQPSRFLRGDEFLRLSLSYYKRSATLEDMRGWAEKLDLPGKALERRVGTYSKGMGQKLGLASAFMVDAPLLLLDEPMSGLDPRARIRLKDVLLAAKGQGKTIFFSSHILSDIDELCDRIAVIHQGRLLYLGTPAAFKQAQNGQTLERSFLSLIDGV